MEEPLLADKYPRNRSWYNIGEGPAPLFLRFSQNVNSNDWACAETEIACSPLLGLFSRRVVVRVALGVMDSDAENLPVVVCACQEMSIYPCGYKIPV